jgi:hypothetical protein
MPRQGGIGGDPPVATHCPWESTDVPVKYKLIGTPHSDESPMDGVTHEPDSVEGTLKYLFKICDLWDHYRYET